MNILKKRMVWSQVGLLIKGAKIDLNSFAIGTIISHTNKDVNIAIHKLERDVLKI